MVFAFVAYGYPFVPAPLVEITNGFFFNQWFLMYYLAVSFFPLTIFFFFKLKYSYNVVLVSGEQNIYSFSCSFPYHLLQDIE